MDDRAARRQRVSSGTRWTGNDQTISAYRVEKLAVDPDLEFDHTAFDALRDDHVVEREHRKDAALAAEHLGLEQHALFGHVIAFEDGADRLEHGVDRDIGQKPEPALVDADQCHIARRERACDIEHGAVAAEHDREVCLAPDLLEHQHRILVVADVRGGEPVDQHFDAALGEKIGEFEQRPGDFRALVFADQADGLE